MADASQDKYLENGRFKLQCDGLTSTQYLMGASIDPMKIEVIECTTGDTQQYRLLKPGATSYGTAKFTFHVDAATNNKDIYDWFAAVQKGDKTNTRKLLSVQLLDRKKAVARTFNLTDCFPIEVHQSEYTTDSKANELTLTVQIGYVTLA